ncbi:hypothetical protein ACR30L_12650 [Psychromonas sp. PT13]|uniref:hypothetical protein n=1 Tax=Psychromonas sp. PT13 TaxID=3439547 RepID=UPI003EB7F315
MLFRKVATKLSQFCAYSYLYKLFINRGKLTDQAKAGRNIALLGLFCPFFWFSLVSGANLSTVLFHAAHSGIVFLMGIVIMLVSFQKNKDK